MTLRVGNVVIDCTDMARMSAFWGALLDMRVTYTDDNWTNLEPMGEGGPTLSFQLVPESKQVKNRLHLDLDVADFEAAGRRAQELGARLAEQPDRPAADFQVWLDPEDNEFCFCRVDGSCP